MKKPFALLFLFIFLFSACDEQSTSFRIGGRDGINPPDSGDVEETPNGTVINTWEQANPSDPKADFLLIVDKSGTLNDDIERMRNAMEGFLDKFLDEDIDLCAGVSFANPKTDQSSIEENHLRQGENSDRVICSNDNSKEDFLTKIRANLTFVSGGTENEAGLMAILNAVGENDSLEEEEQDDVLSHYRSNAFLRDDTALSLVFIADEADISEVQVPTNVDPVDNVIATSLCTDEFADLNLPDLILTPLGSDSPDGNVGLGCEEARVRYDYYSNADGSRKWFHENIAEAVLKFQGTLSLESATIGTSNTHGLNEFTENVQGTFIDLVSEAADQNAFNTAMESIANNTIQAAKTITVFDLSEEACEDSITVKVANNDVENFDISTKELDGTSYTRVSLGASDAGDPGDKIEIEFEPQSDGGC